MSPLSPLAPLKHIDLANRRDAAARDVDPGDSAPSLGDPHLAVGRPDHVPDRVEVRRDRLHPQLLA